MKLSPALSPAIPVSGPRPPLPVSVVPSAPLGFCLILMYVYDVFARLPEISVNLFGTTFLQTPILATLCIGFALVNGSALEGLKVPAGRWLLAFMAWVAVSLPFSFWKSASAETFSVMIRQYILFLLIVALIRSTDQARKAIVSVAFAPLPILLAIRVLSVEDSGGRLQMTFGSFANSNELAGYLMTLAPLAVLVASMPRYNWAIRGCAALLAVGSLLVVSRTGSRGTMFGAAAAILLLFWNYSFSAKIKFALLSIPVLLTVILAIPQEAWLRYSTAFSQRVDKGGLAGELQSSAIESTASRMELLRQSIQLTVENPLFGAGLGTFTAAAAARSQEEGQKALWQVSHNAYTQLSSETGLPSLLFYLGCCASVIYGLSAVKKRCRKLADRNPEAEEVAQVAAHLLVAYIAFSIHGLFTSTAGSFHFFILTGLAVVLIRAAGTEQAQPLLPPAPLLPTPAGKASLPSPEPVPSANRTPKLAYPPVRRLPRTGSPH